MGAERDQQRIKVIHLNVVVSHDVGPGMTQPKETAGCLFLQDAGALLDQAEENDMSHRESQAQDEGNNRAKQKALSKKELSEDQYLTTQEEFCPEKGKQWLYLDYKQWLLGLLEVNG